MKTKRGVKMTQSLDVAIAGMSCNHCVGAVKGALAKIAGVEVEHVEIGHARVRFDPAATTEQAITDAIADEGYEPAIESRG